MTITAPGNFSTIKGPVVFTVSEDRAIAFEIYINNFIKQLYGSDVEINISDYYKGSISPSPIMQDQAAKVITYEGGALYRIAQAQIIVNGEESEYCYIIRSESDIPRNRFLTDLKKRYYTPGQMDELSAASDSLVSQLGISLQNTPDAEPLAPEPTEESWGVQYKVFSLKTSKGFERYAILTNSNQDMLDIVEFIPVDHCPGIRLAWINKYGALDCWNFQITKEKESTIEKTQIYSVNGYTTTQINADDSTTISSNGQPSGVLGELMRIITSPMVWIINEDGTYSEIDIITSSVVTYDINSPKALEISFRPRKRRL